MVELMGEELIIRRGEEPMFAMYKEEFLDIYQQAFTHFPYDRQYLEMDNEYAWLMSMFNNVAAICYFATTGKKLVGFMLVAPANYDHKLTAQMRDSLDLSRIISIAELAVHESFRRQGISTQFLDKFLQDAMNLKFKAVIVRTNANAQSAQALYSKFGFQPWHSCRVENRILAHGQIVHVLTDKIYLKKDLTL